MGASRCTGFGGSFSSKLIYPPRALITQQHKSAAARGCCDVVDPLTRPSRSVGAFACKSSPMSRSGMECTGSRRWVRIRVGGEGLSKRDLAGIET